MEKLMAQTPEGPKRRRFTADLKAEIVKRHLSDKVAISSLCDEYQLQPSVIYGWVKQAVDSLPAVFSGGLKGEGRKDVEMERQVMALKARLVVKDGIIAEISEEYVTIKKLHGER